MTGLRRILVTCVAVGGLWQVAPVPAQAQDTDPAPTSSSLPALRALEHLATDEVARMQEQVDQSRRLLLSVQELYAAGRRTAMQLNQARESLYVAEQRLGEAKGRLQRVRLRLRSASAAPPVAPAADPAPAAQSTAAGPAAAEQGAEVRAAVSERMAGWLAAWRARDIDSYLGFYSPRFQPAQGLTRAQWESQRRRVLGQKGAIELQIVQPRYDARGGVVGVEFEQRYRSGTFRDTVRKRVDWVQEGGTWRIVRESTH